MRTVFAYVLGGLVGAALLVATTYGLYLVQAAFGYGGDGRWWLSLWYFPAAFLFVALYYFGLLAPLKWLEKRLPDSALKRLLFRERGTGR